MSYKVAAPDEYLAITGMGIKNVKITKATWVWPFQRCMRFSVQPHDYTMNLQAMTKEKLQFLLPVVFTVGPDVNRRGANTRGEKHEEPLMAVAPVPAHDDGSHEGSHHDHVDDHHQEDRGDALTKYAMLLADSGGKKHSTANPRQFLENIVKGIVEGETRVLVSSMTMEEIFAERELFKRRVFRNIQSELQKFGLSVYNANVKELKDAPNSIYFESLSRKAHEGAVNTARVDVAEAQLRGNVGEAQRKGEQERELAKINAETAVQKTVRDVERASAEATLATKKTALNRDVDIARIEATRATEEKDEDLKRRVELKRAAAEMERLRASDVVKATIAREAKQQAADAKAYEIEADARAQYEKAVKSTDASAYKTKIDAEAQALADFNRTTKNTDAAAYKTRQDAEAWGFAAVKNADALLFKKLKEAEGLSAMADAYGKLAQAFGGPAGLLQFMMIEKGTYVELAKANAQAVQGMQPKISVWNTGAQAGLEGGSQGSGVAGGAGIETMRNIYQMLPPLMTTINEQTGITLPEWQFGRLAGQMGELERQKGAVTNGQK
ncbi:Flotillin-like protein 1 [Pleurostoma richardsiae]|uniref:Flotillin-like protein 1 n=1 Tax=Pleurostoma richardsiae TaxID=41990 RepID=A0AA38S397_9PEZI|nr:Flotillin-like protein 1 [Pleurostoma richardsiae]